MISGPGADYSNFKVVDYTYKPDKANNKMSDFDYAVRYQKSSEDTKDRGRITNQFFEGTRVRNEPTPKSFALTHPKIQLSNDSYAMRLKYIKLLKLIVHVLTDEQISFF